jgi:hypothetical protein
MRRIAAIHLRRAVECPVSHAQQSGIIGRPASPLADQPSVAKTHQMTAAPDTRRSVSGRSNGNIEPEFRVCLLNISPFNSLVESKSAGSPLATQCTRLPPAKMH